ncbi:hypothetical protein OR1_00499 [Geobacter sp. OR-1]|uniref:prepilin-type N-terminal cleavage/methylation domain-containing protein n=1 Tax=Geobacter sp. OR-1 TaxID=1266765 RepID=UPI000543D91F|nr:prepilin-type N-terminal cleavage/methylation domain-containing protein [Geobacter sp. OR-1]GAM08228.1 hypothetical protein OR1_00499 [Geobacter sp. OR-1]
MAFPKNNIRRLTKSSAGFTLVEVLIATLIMVISIVTVTAAVRQFALQREKLTHYEQLYTTVLSLRDRIMNERLNEGMPVKGALNGLNYQYNCRKVESANNYVFGEEEGQSGNKGVFLITLFSIHLDVEGREFEFYKTQYEKRFEASKD